MSKNELPDGCEWEKLGEVLSIIYRYPSYYGIEYVEDGIPEVRGELLLGNGEIQNDFSKFRYISNDTSRNFPKTILKEGDIVISVRGTIGKIGLVRSWLEKANITANLLRLSPNREIINSEYLKYFLLSDKFNKELNSLSPHTIIKTIRVPSIHSILVPIPPLEEQERIVSKLDRQMAQIEMMKKEAEKQTEFQEKIRNSYLNKLFMSLQLERSRRLCLSDITKITSGSTPLRDDSSYYGGNIPWIKTGELQNNIINDSEEKVTQKALDETSLKLNPPDTLLVAMYGQGKTRGMTGLVKIESTTNQACCAIYPNYDIFIPEYLQMWFMANYESLRSLSEGRGGNQPNLNGELIKQLEVPFPDKDIQKRLLEYFKKIYKISNEIDSNINMQLQAINRLSNSILNELFGKYEIPDEA